MLTSSADSSLSHEGMSTSGPFDAHWLSIFSASKVRRRVGPKHKARIALLTGTVGEFRDVWEETSFVIERLQAAEACVDEEQAGLSSRVAPSWHLSFTPTPTPPHKLSATDKVAHLSYRDFHLRMDSGMWRLSKSWDVV